MTKFIPWETPDFKKQGFTPSIFFLQRKSTVKILKYSFDYFAKPHIL